MLINFWPLTWTRSDVNFGDLANVQTVGIGLYLALAVIQAISTTGVAGLSRRVNTLKKAVTSARLGAIESSNVRRLQGIVGGLEIGFHDMNRLILRAVFVMFFVSVSYFGYCAANQDIDAGKNGVWFIYLYYLFVPILIFLTSSLLIANRCREAEKQVIEAEKRIGAALLGLS